MIRLTTNVRETLILNADLIESIEGSEETVLCLTNGRQVSVVETADQVIAQVIGQRRLRSGGRYDFDATVSFLVCH